MDTGSTSESSSEKSESQLQVLLRTLAEREEHFHFLAEGLPIYVWYGSHGTIDFCNQNLLEFLGLSMEQIRTGESLKRIHPEDIERVMVATRAALASGEPFVQEYRIRRADGEYRWHLAHSRRFASGDGVLRWLGTSIDVTERKQAEDALRKAYETLELAQDVAGVGTWEWDIPTRVLRWSAAVERQHGFEPGTFDGKVESWLATIHPEDREEAPEAVRNAVITGSFDTEYRTLREDGTIFWTAVRGKLLRNEHGDPMRLLGVCMDITDRKMTQDVLIKTEKLAAAGRLAASIAHEVNNPLEAVTNLLYLASRDPAESAQYIQMAQQELQRAANITKQTLGFYRDPGTAEIFDVNGLLDEILNMYRPRMEHRKIAITRETEKHLELMAFRGELRQVFSNVIANAVDACKVGGAVHIGSRQLNGLVEVSIEDNGVGIAEADMQRIFEPFFTTKRDVGTGLGLWISKQLVEKHCGTINVRSEVGKGSRFEIRVPIGTAAAKTRAVGG